VQLRWLLRWWRCELLGQSPRSEACAAGWLPAGVCLLGVTEGGELFHTRDGGWGNVCCTLKSAVFVTAFNHSGPPIESKKIAHRFSINRSLAMSRVWHQHMAPHCVAHSTPLCKRHTQPRTAPHHPVTTKVAATTAAGCCTQPGKGSARAGQLLPICTSASAHACFHCCCASCWSPLPPAFDTCSSPSSDHPLRGCCCKSCGTSRQHAERACAHVSTQLAGSSKSLIRASTPDAAQATSCLELHCACTHQPNTT
jgi:hypothetical protein